MKIIITMLLTLLTFSSLATTSKENRANLKNEGFWRLGSDFGLGTGEEFGFGRYIDPDHQLSLRLGRGEDRGNDSDDYDEKQVVAALQYKSFQGNNSFYVSPGLYYLNYHATKKVDEVSGPTEHFNTVGFDVRIGNQWQWSHWTIGIDWLGIGRNLIQWSNTSDHDFKYSTTLLNINVGYAW
jgi:hypothetical protein